MTMFKPTLAVNADFTKIQYPVYASPKLDGIRCSIVDGKALSRTLKPIPNKFIQGELNCPAFTGFDGELIVGSPTSKTCYNESVSAVMRHEGEPTFTYYLFDMHDFNGDFEARWDVLNCIVGEHPFLKVLEQKLLHTEAEMLEYEALCVSQGYEGIILRKPTAPYKHGRSTVNEGYLLKVKRFEDSEAEVIGFEEEMFNGNEAEVNELGRTKRSTAQAGLVGKDTLGAFLVRDLVTGIEFSIGTGLTAEQRRDAWANRDTLMGSVRKYKFFPVGVKDKPRHPVDLGPRSLFDL
jgi:DNA ligase-1